LTVAYLALGSNMGDRLAHLQHAVDMLAATPGVRLLAVSRVYETDPVGGPVQDDYYNAVVGLETDLDPWGLLAVAQRCEEAAHRVRRERWGPRTLDVDVLLYDDLRLDDPTLTIPHPRMWERDFVLVPLADVAPDRVPAGQAGKGVREAPVALAFSPPSP
jgi:2-amino-4-hydroxy-6-hydroxymethyldihydropteridine diphosphokinase